MPIIMLTSFIIGVVLAYEGIVQLSKFGAKTVVVGLIGFSILREAGVLITSVVMAGRSGSAFTAEIGTMKAQEELDALKLMGINPLHLLVIPRILAMMCVMPILTLVADITGLMGGALICHYYADVNITLFFLKLQDTIAPLTFWLGMIKAPFFGMIIALMGCLEGLKVERNAESVGKHTTESVVKSIFLVIVLNGLFSVLFSNLQL
jgi:phospholipid/cholesterol/gamma-HCH transport system permease protein